MTAAPSCSGWRPSSGARWPRWLADAPHLVAEALTAVQDPLPAWLRPEAAAPAAVAAALASALLPPAATDAPPAWLRADQRLSFARALAAARRYGGALLADGVGTGKTFIGLAVAAALEPGRATQVVAPAALLSQWRTIAARLGVEVRLHSHETLSRGRAPRREPGPLLVDESHRFRAASTRRYATLAPWCVGRRGLLLSATPVVNRLDDLSQQLLLLVRDDALRWAGVASLRCLSGGLPAGALAELVVTGEDRSHLLPAARERDLRPETANGSPLESLREGIRDLALSTDHGIASLLRSVLLLALASSPLAVAEALRRYRALLQHARDAAATGRTLSRQAIRRSVGSEPDQLVLWPLVAEDGMAAELALDDLVAAGRLELVARHWSNQPDAKVAALRAAIADSKPTLVFSASTATVRYLRQRLGRGVAWCAGRAAGLDGLSMPRDAVLDWFRSARLGSDQIAPRPRLLIATDVAAEGLDLPLVERVVHYDLPWTAVRLEQRSGRALRLGSRHADVEVIRFLPTRELEAALHLQDALARKAVLPDCLGLGTAPTAPWRLRARIAARWSEVPRAHGIASVGGGGSALVAGIRLHLADGSCRDLVQARVAAAWSDDPSVIAALLESAHGDLCVRTPPTRRLPGAMRLVAGLARKALRSSHGQDLLAGPRPAAQRRALRRVVGLAREAARSRNQERLAVLERGLGVLRRGHTAGEARLVERWAALPLATLLASFRSLPREPGGCTPTRIELIGVLLVEPGETLR